MKRIAALFICSLVCLSVVLPALTPARTAHAAHLKRTTFVTVPCGAIWVPYNVYSMPITQTETLTLTFTSSGEGFVTFSANTDQHFSYVQGDANCGSCSLSLLVQPGARQSMQLALDASAAYCPAPGITIGNFHLQITPTSPH